VIKKLILIASFCLVANANLNLKIKNLLGSSDYNTHINLINHIFNNNNMYYKNNQINYTNLTQQLQNNGLLKLNLGSVQDIEITFNINYSPKKSLKNLNDILRALGHHNFITTEKIVVNNNLKWKIKLTTAAAINPLRLSQELQSINCSITDIIREGTNKWEYSINTKNSLVYKAEDLTVRNELNLKKPIKPYIIRVDNLTKIAIDSHSGNNWYPNIIFYDNELSIIEIFEADSLHRSLKLDVPNNTKYIKIDDLYTLANLKRGINITKE